MSSLANGRSWLHVKEVSLSKLVLHSHMSFIFSFVGRTSELWEKGMGKVYRVSKYDEPDE